MSEPLLDDETRRWLRQVFRFAFGPPTLWHIVVGVIIGIGVIYYLLRVA